MALFFHLQYHKLDGVGILEDGMSLSNLLNTRIHWMDTISTQIFLEIGLDPLSCYSGHIQSMPPSPPLDNIRVMVIVWRLRGNIIRTAPCWVV